jgi:hypothetical protein
MLLNKLTQHWLEEFVAGHDGRSPADFTWRRSTEWDRNHANSKELAEREADMDLVYKAFELAEAGDFSSALRLWTELAELGSVWSMVEVGRCHQFGRGVVRDPDGAEAWFRRAFAGGSQIAMLKCAGAAASRGDYAACEAILQVGVDKKWAPAIFWQAWYRHARSESPETYRAILPMLKTAAKSGHPAARMVLASCMVRGKFGVWRIPLGLLLAAKAALDEDFEESAEAEGVVRDTTSKG